MCEMLFPIVWVNKMLNLQVLGKLNNWGFIHYIGILWCNQRKWSGEVLIYKVLSLWINNKPGQNSKWTGWWTYYYYWVCNKNVPWRFCQFVASLQRMNQPFCSAAEWGNRCLGNNRMLQKSTKNGIRCSLLKRFKSNYYLSKGGDHLV